MIIPFLLTGSLLLLTPVKDTVWWNTSGGKVLEHRDSATATCTLWLYDQHGHRVAFTWAKDQPLSVSAIAPALTMPSDSSHIPVSLQIGDEWLDNGKFHDAIGFGNSFSFVIHEAVEDRLRSADHITIHTPRHEFVMNVNQAKIGILLNQVGKCRQGVAK